MMFFYYTIKQYNTMFTHSICDSFTTALLGIFSRVPDSFQVTVATTGTKIPALGMKLLAGLDFGRYL
jgi:hypothetical protein